MKRSLIIGVFASASVLGVPAAFVPFTAPAAAHAGEYETVNEQWLATEREMREEEARYLAASKGLDRKSGQAKQLKDQHERKMNEIRGRRQNLRARLDRMGPGAGKPQPGAVAQKLENVGDQIANENQRHAEKMKTLPRGSAAAAAEVERHEARMRELNATRTDLREDRGDKHAAQGAVTQYRKDTAGLKAALAQEDERHKKAMKHLPAYSPAAQEEERYHQQRIRAIEDEFERAGDRRDQVMVDAGVRGQFDASIDAVDAQIAQEEARHGRRMKELNAGSAAAAEESERYAATMGGLREQKLRLQQQQANSRTGKTRVFEIRRQMDEIDAHLAYEKTRHDRLMNEFAANSPQVQIERDRYATACGNLNARKAALQSELAAIEGTASGR